MTTQDPFQCLSFESAGNILYHLDPQTVVRCERVSKGWRDFVRAWIVSWGFSSNFRGQSKDTNEDPAERVRRFKELAAVEANLSSGKPTSVRKIEARDGLVIAGNFAVWRTGGDMYWQRLDFKENGSLFPVNKLCCDPPPHRCWSFMLNADGYLVVERRELDPRDPNMSIDVYSLEENRKVHTLNDPDGLDPRVKGVPVAVGAQRIYFLLRNAIHAYDLFTGVQLYSVPFAENSHMPVRGPSMMRSGYSQGYKTYFPPLNDGRRELLPILWSRALQIINGEDGTLLQEIAVDCWRFPYMVVAPSKKEFAVVSVRNEPKIAMELRVQRFSIGPDGMFSESLHPVEHISLDFKYTGHNIVAIDPFRHLVAIPSVARNIPEIAELISGEFESVFIPDDQNDTRSIVALCRGTVHEITLPPKYAHHKTRRLIVPDDNYSAKDMLFVDGDRILYRTKHVGVRPDAYYIFDFRLRAKGGIS
ncbi:hypothetical protein BJX65DRAFT_287681 [Aspergillus insuetus]